MPFELNEEVWINLWGESELKGEAVCIDKNDDEIDRANLPHVGKLWQCYTNLQDGLGLEIREIEVAEDLLHTGEGCDESTGAGLAFFLSGKVLTTLHGLTGEIEEVVGHHYLESSVGIPETELWVAGEPFGRLYLQIDPLRLFSNLSCHQIAQLPIELQHTLAGNHRPYYRIGVITPEMHRVLQQILRCPYEGLLKRMYLHGKAWELMALQFEQFQTEQQALTIGRLKPSEIERIHHAKDILICHLDDPPSLMELARQTGINDFALKQGFRQVFGTTVFQYLHDYRLNVARQLLASDDLQIKAVAQRVGFANGGYFAAAFRKKFGLSPKAYSLEKTPCRDKKTPSSAQM